MEAEEEKAAAAAGNASCSFDDEKSGTFTLFTGSLESSQMDESLCFELSDKKEHAKLAIFSLRRRAMEFSRRIQIGEKPDKVWLQQQKDAGSIWNSDVCLPELLCLLPIAAFRCPTLLHAEHIVWGLLPTNWGFTLLSAIIVNNPLLVRDALLLLSDFLLSHQDSSIAPEPAALQSTTQPATKHQLGKFTGEHMLQPQVQSNPTMVHCVKQALLTVLQLSKLSCSLACMCREVLVRNCASAGIVVYLTTEHLHDELDFLSKIIFSDQKTSEWMLSYLGSTQKDCSLVALLLLIESTKLMNGSRLGNPENERQSVTKDDPCNHLQGGAYRIRKALLADAQTIREKYGWCGQLHGHLRLYCVLIRTAELQPMHEEVEFWLKSFSEAGGFVCKQTLQLGVSFFCLVPGLTNTASKSLFHKGVSAILKWKVSEERRFSSESEELAVWFAVQLFLRQFSEIAMVVREVLGMHVTVHNALIRELHDAAMAVEIISEPYMLVKAVSALRPKGPISNKTKHGYYVLKCLEQLLTSGHFSHNGVDVSEAVLHCISVSAKPIHMILIQVIQAYADAPAVLLHGKAGSQTFRMLPLPRWFLEASMVTIPSLTQKLETDGIEVKVESTDDTIAREAIVSYYMLCRERVLRNVGVDTGCESSLTLFFSPTECEGSWWTTLLARIPFRELLHHMEKSWLDFEHLFPQWLSLAAALFPERLHVPALLEGLIDSFGCVSEFAEGVTAIDDVEWTRTLITTSEHLRNGSGDKGLGEIVTLYESFTSVRVSEKSVVLSVDLARRAMRNALMDPLPALEILNFFYLNLSSHEEQDYGDLVQYQVLIIKELVPKLLDIQCTRCLQDKFCTWFKCLQPLLRQTLLPAFVEVILDTSQNSKANSETGLVMAQIKALIFELDTSRIGTYNDLVQQPLTILACKLEVYRTPLLSIVLDVLSEFLTVNRRICLGVASDGSAREQPLKLEEVTAALMAQDSAVCQILLEACLPNVGFGDDVRPGPLLEARKVICGFLSSFLETNHLLLKLLHFQGYDPQLVSMMVEGVPVMVQCLAFVPELLQQKQQSKQVFTIILIANVARKHIELPESLAAVQKAIAHVSFVQCNVCGSSEFMQGVLEVMAQCACTFPTVAAEIMNILQSCVKSSGPLQRNGPPRDPMLHTASLSAFKHLVHQKALFGRLSPLPSSFVIPIHEN